MLDVQQIRKQIDEAVTQRDLMKKQREQLDSAIRTIEQYISVSEQMLRLTTRQTEQTFAQEEQRPGPQTRPDSLRNQVLKSLAEAGGSSVSVSVLWDKAAHAGFRTKSADPIQAVKFALFDLRKHGAPIERSGENMWRYVSTAPENRMELYPGG